MSQTNTEHQEFLGIRAIICSAAMRDLMRRLERLAMTSATVLITGETGCGKELIARAIHHHSLRNAKPWVDLNCAALPEHLIESELFGHERGAFSGADTTKQGLFELAHSGTMFLDEIGELHPKMQVKLLRVLDGTPYYRLGAVRKTSVDVRILAATNRDLAEDVRTGAFRRDLFHRLSQIQVRVPPLRERPDDILPIAEFFLSQHDPRFRFSEDAETILLRHSWPGNVRELRNMIGRAAVFAEDFVVRAADLGFETEDYTPVPDNGVASTLDGMEKRMIIQVLAQTGGHQRRAAEVLGISRRTLSRKLKIYGMEVAYQNCVA